MKILEAKDLVYHYDHKSKSQRPAVDGLTLEVEPGEVVALIGPNGSGKTTTLSMLTGQIFAQSGEISINGHKMGPEALEARRAIGFVPDRPDLYEYLTGRQYVRLVGAMYGLRAAEADKQSEKWWRRFDLEFAQDQLLKTYSHGMRQRVVIAAMLTHNPTLFILDEPIVGLDPQSAKVLKEVVREQAKGGGGVIFSTHLLSIAAQIADRVVMIQHGKVRAKGTVDDLRKEAGMDHSNDLEEVFFKLLGEQSYGEKRR